MPSIDVAMARSLQPGPWEKLTNAVARTVSVHLQGRDIVGDAKDSVDDVQTAFSSWDNCMAADFCKWPAIAVIVVGSLIILAILTCIVRCACCAKSCCCSCFSCLKCCGNCCGCCDPPGSRKHKYLDEPYIPPHQGYRTEAPMHATFPPSSGVTPPQYAEFDSGPNKRGGEDSLPQMPSWEGANSKKVELEQDAVELNNLDKSPSEKTTPGDPHANHASSPGVVGPVPVDNGRSPYGRSTPAQPAMMGGPGLQQQRDPYGQPNDGYGLDQPYDSPSGPSGPLPPVAAMAAPPGRSSPAPGRNPYGPGPGPGPMAAVGGRNSPAPGRNPYGPGPSPLDQGPAEMPAPPNEYASRDPYRHTPSPGPPPMGPPPMGPPAGYGQRVGSPGPGPRGYGPRPGMGRPGNNSPAPYGMDPRMRNSPGPRPPRTPGQRTGSPANAGGYGSPMGSPARDNFSRSYSPAPGPDRQYSQSPRPLNMGAAPPQSPLGQLRESPSSPIVNTGGFDFTSGFSRPQTSDGPSQFDRRPSESRETPAQEGYPGYKPYRPAQEGWTGV